MSFLNDNKFLVALAGGTLAGVGLLYFWGASGATHYEEAKIAFEQASTEASGYEKLSLYPKIENRDGKRKAIDEYKKSLESLESAFSGYRSAEIKDISPQEFTNRLKSADDEVRKAFEDSGTTVPDAFFMGFEGYKSVLARPNSTGILDYQLGAIKSILVNLAKSGPTEFKNIYRPTLPEEDGTAYVPPADGVARPLPLELTFIGPEKSSREFLTSLANPKNQFVVIRAIRISNVKKDPPKSSDAKFDKPVAKAGADSAFAGGFVLPGEEPAAKPEAAPAAADSSRILAQVLGSEDVQVFVRLEIFQFLPAKKLP